MHRYISDGENNAISVAIQVQLHSFLNCYAGSLAPIVVVVVMLSMGEGKASIPTS